MRTLFVEVEDGVGGDERFAGGVDFLELLLEEGAASGGLYGEQRGGGGVPGVVGFIFALLDEFVAGAEQFTQLRAVAVGGLARMQRVDAGAHVIAEQARVNGVVFCEQAE